MNDALNKYIGCKYDLIKNNIEKEFPPYKTIECNEDCFYCEIYYLDGIRCLVVDNIITNIQVG
jgi:hypothetical protein